MKILELDIQGFGRFSRRHFDLGEGLNLFYGENEAGKTTLEHFIVGMLYGFFVPATRRKTYSPDYDAYLPWNSAAPYAGSMTLEKDGRLYRIQRVFQKERESVRIFDARSGEELSDGFPYDPVTRLRNPGLFFTGLSREVFGNTALVGQLGAALDGGFSTGWEDQLLSMTETADSSLSLQGACARLDQKAEEIGSPKRSKSPYGQAAQQAELLRRELQEAQEQERQTLTLRQRLFQLRQQKTALENRQQQEDQQLLRQQFQRASELRQRVRELQKLLQEEPAQDPEKLQEDWTLCRQARQDLAQREADLGKWEQKLQTLNRRYLAQPLRCQDAAYLDRCLLLAKNSAGSPETARLREELQRKQQDYIQLPLGRANSAWEALIEYESWEEDRQKNRFPAKWALFGAGFVIVGLCALLGWQLDPFFYVGCGLGLLLCISSLFLSSGKKEAREAEEEQRRILEEYKMEDYQQLKDYCQHLREQEEQRGALMDDIQLLALRLQKLSQEDPKRQEELDRCAARLTRDPKAKWQPELEPQVQALRKLCEEFAQLSEGRAQDLKQVKALRQQQEERELALRQHLEALGIQQQEGGEEEALEQLRALRRQREQAAVELELQQQRLGDCLEGKTFEELEALCTEPGSAVPVAVEKAGDYRQVLEELASLQGKLSALEQLQRPAGQVQEELKAVEEQCSQYQQTLAAITLAKERLLAASGSIRQDWSPQLAHSLSQLIAELTQGRYRRILLDRELHIRLEEPDSGQLVPLSSLSNGTIDLVYLGLRLELLKLLSPTEALPLILDDSFVQLDDRRCSALLLFLSREQSGQVLLFSCHRREAAILRQGRLPHKLIPLTEE